jgi:hypothetical protein
MTKEEKIYKYVGMKPETLWKKKSKTLENNV